MTLEPFTTIEVGGAIEGIRGLSFCLEEYVQTACRSEITRAMIRGDAKVLTDDSVKLPLVKLTPREMGLTSNVKNQILDQDNLLNWSRKNLRSSQALFLLPINVAIMLPVTYEKSFSLVTAMYPFPVGKVEEWSLVIPNCSRNDAGDLSERRVGLVKVEDPQCFDNDLDKQFCFHLYQRY